MRNRYAEGSRVEASIESIWQNNPIATRIFAQDIC